jgi:hypothetical protein
MSENRLIWFCYGMEQTADNPDWLKRLSQKIGLTTIMPESPICHTSGFAASEALAQRGPFEDWRQREAAWPKAKEGIYPPVAGIVSGYDDGPILRLIEAAHTYDIEVWGHIGLWSYGGEVFPEFAMRDLWGKPLSDRYKAWGTGLCPSRSEINEWTRDGLLEVLERYEVDGFCVDHARYPAPANLASLAACGCEACQQEIGRLGGDFSRLQQGVACFMGALEGLTPQRVQQFLQSEPSLWDFIGAFEGGIEVLEWLHFRARLLAERMKEFRDAVQQAAGADMVFGSDVFPPSIALLGGHDYTAWEKGADYFTGGSSAGGVVGWATAVTNLAGEWVPDLCKIVKGLEEADALRLVYRLFGYADFDLPLSLEGLKQDALPLAAIYAREVGRLKAVTSGKRPLYPPISLSSDAGLVGQLCDAVSENQCDGAMLSFGASQEGIDHVTNSAIKTTLRALGG